MSRFAVLFLMTTMVGLLAACTAAAAANPTRAEYVEQLEAICKPKAQATERVTDGARTDIRKERLAVAAGKFARATQIFRATVDEIKPVPRPAADASVLARWFPALDKQESYLEQITEQLRAGHAIKAQRLTARFIHSGNEANVVVLSFDFHYCSFEFSRYG